jgi:divalent metal cation (Fe/Co/Zn/Cd) transporter
MQEDIAVRERAHAAALGVPQVREVHNVSVLDVGTGNELSLHLKLPGNLSLEEAHEIAEQVERAIHEAVPEVSSVQTHLEPLEEEGAGRRPRPADVADDRATVARIVRDATGFEPEELRFLKTEEGLVAYLTLRLGSDTPLAEAHGQASRIEETIRRERPEIADVIVHTEPRS